MSSWNPHHQANNTILQSTSSTYYQLDINYKQNPETVELQFTAQKKGELVDKGADKEKGKGFGRIIAPDMLKIAACNNVEETKLLDTSKCREEEKENAKGRPHSQVYSLNTITKDANDKAIKPRKEHSEVKIAGHRVCRDKARSKSAKDRKRRAKRSCKELRSAAELLDLKKKSKHKKDKAIGDDGSKLDRVQNAPVPAAGDKRPPQIYFLLSSPAGPLEIAMASKLATDKSVVAKVKHSSKGRTKHEKKSMVHHSHDTPECVKEELSKGSSSQKVHRKKASRDNLDPLRCEKISLKPCQSKTAIAAVTENEDKAKPALQEDKLERRKLRDRTREKKHRKRASSESRKDKRDRIPNEARKSQSVDSAVAKHVDKMSVEVIKPPGDAKAKRSSKKKRNPSVCGDIAQEYTSKAVTPAQLEAALKNVSVQELNATKSKHQEHKRNQIGDQPEKQDPTHADKPEELQKQEKKKVYFKFRLGKDKKKEETAQAVPQSVPKEKVTDESLPVVNEVKSLHKKKSSHSAKDTEKKAIDKKKDKSEKKDKTQASEEEKPAPKVEDEKHRKKRKKRTETETVLSTIEGHQEQHKERRKKHREKKEVRQSLSEEIAKETKKKLTKPRKKSKEGRTSKADTHGKSTPMDASNTDNSAQKSATVETPNGSRRSGKKSKEDGNHEVIKISKSKYQALLTMFRLKPRLKQSKTLYYNVPKDKNEPPPRKEVSFSHLNLNPVMALYMSTSHLFTDQHKSALDAPNTAKMSKVLPFDLLTREKKIRKVRKKTKPVDYKSAVSEAVTKKELIQYVHGKRYPNRTARNFAFCDNIVERVKKAARENGTLGFTVEGVEPPKKLKPLELKKVCGPVHRKVSAKGLHITVLSVMEIKPTRQESLDSSALHEATTQTVDTKRVSRPFALGTIHEKPSAIPRSQSLKKRTLNRSQSRSSSSSSESLPRGGNLPQKKRAVSNAELLKERGRSASRSPSKTTDFLDKSHQPERRETNRDGSQNAIQVVISRSDWWKDSEASVAAKGAKGVTIEPVTKTIDKQERMKKFLQDYTEQRGTSMQESARRRGSSISSVRNGSCSRERVIAALDAKTFSVKRVDSGLSVSSAVSRRLKPETELQSRKRSSSASLRAKNEAADKESSCFFRRSSKEGESALLLNREGSLMKCGSPNPPIIAQNLNLKTENQEGRGGLSGEGSISSKESSPEIETKSGLPIRTDTSNEKTPFRSSLHRTSISSSKERSTDQHCSRTMDTDHTAYAPPGPCGGRISQNRTCSPTVSRIPLFDRKPRSQKLTSLPPKTFNGDHAQNTARHRQYSPQGSVSSVGSSNAPAASRAIPELQKAVVKSKPLQNEGGSGSLIKSKSISPIKTVGNSATISKDSKSQATLINAHPSRSKKQTSPQRSSIIKRSRPSSSGTASSSLSENPAGSVKDLERERPVHRNHPSSEPLRKPSIDLEQPDSKHKRQEEKRDAFETEPNNFNGTSLAKISEETSSQNSVNGSETRPQIFGGNRKVFEKKRKQKVKGKSIVSFCSSEETMEVVDLHESKSEKKTDASICTPPGNEQGSERVLKVVAYSSIHSRPTVIEESYSKCDEESHQNVTALGYVSSKSRVGFEKVFEQQTGDQSSANVPCSEKGAHEQEGVECYGNSRSSYGRDNREKSDNLSAIEVDDYGRKTEYGETSDGHNEVDAVPPREDLHLDRGRSGTQDKFRESTPSYYAGAFEDVSENATEFEKDNLSRATRDADSVETGQDEILPCKYVREERSHKQTSKFRDETRAESLAQAEMNDSNRTEITDFSLGTDERPAKLSGKVTKGSQKVSISSFIKRKSATGVPLEGDTKRDKSNPRDSSISGDTFAKRKRKCSREILSGFHTISSSRSTSVGRHKISEKQDIEKVSASKTKDRSKTPEREQVASRVLEKNKDRPKSSEEARARHSEVTGATVEKKRSYPKKKLIEVESTIPKCEKVKKTKATKEGNHSVTTETGNETEQENNQSSVSQKEIEHLTRKVKKNIIKDLTESQLLKMDKSLKITLPRVDKKLNDIISKNIARALKSKQVSDDVDRGSFTDSVLDDERSQKTDDTQGGSYTDAETVVPSETETKPREKPKTKRNLSVGSSAKRDKNACTCGVGNGSGQTRAKSESSTNKVKAKCFQQEATKQQQKDSSKERLHLEQQRNKDRQVQQEKRRVSAVDSSPTSELVANRFSNNQQRTVSVARSQADHFSCEKAKQTSKKRISSPRKSFMKINRSPSKKVKRSAKFSERSDRSKVSNDEVVSPEKCSHFSDGFETANKFPGLTTDDLHSSDNASHALGSSTLKLVEEGPPRSLPIKKPFRSNKPKTNCGLLANKVKDVTVSNFQKRKQYGEKLRRQNAIQKPSASVPRNYKNADEKKPSISRYQPLNLGCFWNAGRSSCEASTRTNTTAAEGKEGTCYLLTSSNIPISLALNKHSTMSLVRSSEANCNLIAQKPCRSDSGERALENNVYHTFTVLTDPPNVTDVFRNKFKGTESSVSVFSRESIFSYGNFSPQTLDSACSSSNERGACGARSGCGLRVNEEVYSEGEASYRKVTRSFRQRKRSHLNRQDMNVNDASKELFSTLEPRSEKSRLKIGNMSSYEFRNSVTTDPLRKQETKKFDCKKVPIRKQVSLLEACQRLKNKQKQKQTKKSTKKADGSTFFCNAKYLFSGEVNKKTVNRWSPRCSCKDEDYYTIFKLDSDLHIRAKSKKSARKSAADQECFKIFTYSNVIELNMDCPIEPNSAKSRLFSCDTKENTSNTTVPASVSLDESGYDSYKSKPRRSIRHMLATKEEKTAAPIKCFDQEICMKKISPQRVISTFPVVSSVEKNCSPSDTYLSDSDSCSSVDRRRKRFSTESSATNCDSSTPRSTIYRENALPPYWTDVDHENAKIRAGCSKCDDDSVPCAVRKDEKKPRFRESFDKNYPNKEAAKKCNTSYEVVDEKRPSLPGNVNGGNSELVKTPSKFRGLIRSISKQFISRRQASQNSSSSVLNLDVEIRSENKTSKRSFFRYHSRSVQSDKSSSPAGAVCCSECSKNKDCHQKQMDQCHKYAEKVMMATYQRKFVGHRRRVADFKEIPLSVMLGTPIPRPTSEATQRPLSAPRGSSEGAQRPPTISEPKLHPLESEPRLKVLDGDATLKKRSKGSGIFKRFRRVSFEACSEDRSDLRSKDGPPSREEESEVFEDDSFPSLERVQSKHSKYFRAKLLRGMFKNKSSNGSCACKHVIEDKPSQDAENVLAYPVQTKTGTPFKETPRNREQNEVSYEDEEEREAYSYEYQLSPSSSSYGNSNLCCPTSTLDFDEDAYKHVKILSGLEKAAPSLEEFCSEETYNYVQNLYEKLVRWRSNNIKSEPVARQEFYCQACTGIFSPPIEEPNSSRFSPDPLGNSSQGSRSVGEDSARSWRANSGSLGNSVEDRGFGPAAGAEVRARAKNSARPSDREEPYRGERSKPSSPVRQCSDGIHCGSSSNNSSRSGDNLMPRREHGFISREDDEEEVEERFVDYEKRHSIKAAAKDSVEHARGRQERRKQLDKKEQAGPSSSGKKGPPGHAEKGCVTDGECEGLEDCLESLKKVCCGGNCKYLKNLLEQLQGVPKEDFEETLKNAVREAAMGSSSSLKMFFKSVEDEPSSDISLPNLKDDKKKKYVREADVEAPLVKLPEKKPASQSPPRGRMPLAMLLRKRPKTEQPQDEEDPKKGRNKDKEMKFSLDKPYAIKETGAEGTEPKRTPSPKGRSDPAKEKKLERGGRNEDLQKLKDSLTDKELFEKLLDSYEQEEKIVERLSTDDEFFHSQLELVRSKESIETLLEEDEDEERPPRVGSEELLRMLDIDSLTELPVRHRRLGHEQEGLALRKGPSKSEKKSIKDKMANLFRQSDDDVKEMLPARNEVFRRTSENVSYIRKDSVGSNKYKPNEEAEEADESQKVTFVQEKRPFEKDKKMAESVDRFLKDEKIGNIDQTPSVECFTKEQLVRPSEIGRCFLRGFRADHVSLNNDTCLLIGKRPLKAGVSEKESFIDFSERDSPLEYLLALGFSIDEASNAIRDDDVKNRLYAAINEARVWVNQLNTLQGTLLYLVAYKAKPRTMRYFLQLVEAIVNRRINDAVKLDGFIRVLEKVEDGDLTMLSVVGADKLESEENEERIVKKQLRELFLHIYKVAEEEAEQKRKPLSKCEVMLLRILAARYRAGLHPHLELIARYVGQGLLKTEIQLEAAMIYLSRLDTAEVKLNEFEQYCGIICDKKDKKKVEGVASKASKK